MDLNSNETLSGLIGHTIAPFIVYSYTENEDSLHYSSVVSGSVSSGQKSEGNESLESNSKSQSEPTNLKFDVFENLPKFDANWYKDEQREYDKVEKNGVGFSRFLEKVHYNEASSVLNGTWDQDESEKMWKQILGEERDTNLVFENAQIVTEEMLIKAKEKVNVILLTRHLSDFVNYHVGKDLKPSNSKFEHNVKYVLLFGGVVLSEAKLNKSYLNPNSFIFGNDNFEMSNDLYYSDAQAFKSSWELLDCRNKPEPRAFHSCCVVYSTLQCPILLICGGLSERKHLLEMNLYVLNLNTEPLEWTILHTSGKLLPKRFGHSMSHVGNYVVVFGGSNGKSLLNDLWVLNVNNGTFLVPGKISNCWTNVQVSGLVPSPRFFQATCKAGISSNSPMLVFGGVTFHESLRTRIFALHCVANDKFVWSLLPVYVKCPLETRAFHTMTYVNNAIVITGGDDYKNRNVRNIRSLCYSLEHKTFQYIEDTPNLSGHGSWCAFGMIYHWGGIKRDNCKISFDHSISISNPLAYSDEANIEEIYVRYIQFASMNSQSDVKKDKKDKECSSKSSTTSSEKKNVTNTNKVKTDDVVDYNTTVKNVIEKKDTGARPRRSAAAKCLNTIEEDNLRHKEMEKLESNTL